MRRFVALLLIVLFAGDALASRAIRGTVWPQRSEARRAKQERATVEKNHFGLFGMLRHSRDPRPETPVRNREGDQSVILVRSDSVHAYFNRENRPATLDLTIPQG